MTEYRFTSRGLAYFSSDLRPPWRRGGRPVVLHHGIGTNSHIWSDWLPCLASRHLAICFDFRGFGRSIVPPEDHSWSMRELVDDLFEVASLAGDGPVHLVGESMGGTVALAAALAQPERVASVTISNAAYKGQGIGRLPGWKSEIEQDGVAGWADRMMEMRFAPGAVDADRLAWFSGEQARSKAHVVLGLGELLAKQDLTAALSKMRSPLLILAPDSSPFVPLELATELAELVPHAELSVFSGVRHGLPFSHGEQASRMTCDFLDRVELGRAGAARLS